MQSEKVTRNCTAEDIKYGEAANEPRPPNALSPLLLAALEYVNSHTELVTIYTCSSCKMPTLSPSWTDASVTEIHPDTGVPTRKQVSLPLCPICSFTPYGRECCATI